MNNFTELKMNELEEVNGGFVISTACAVIVVLELVGFAIAETYLYHANKALEVKAASI